MHYDIYTDGSLKNGQGSWAFLMLCDSEILLEKSGRAQNVSCNQMEFQAAIEGLKALKKIKSNITIHTDSRELIEKVEQFEEWKKYGWKKKNGRPIPYVEQFQMLDQLLISHKKKLNSVNFKWVKAHSGNVLNERCDKLCIQARS